MRETKIAVDAADGVTLRGYVWEPDSSEAEMALLIVHGMAEHCARYRQFADYLSTHGIAVVAYDQRGHGMTGAEDIGFAAESDGALLRVQDVSAVWSHMRTRITGVPAVLMGHSMGSFVARIAAEEMDAAGLILSGTGTDPGFLGTIGRMLAARKAKNAPRGPAADLQNMVFAPNIKPFLPSETAFDWLSRDRDQVRAYIADPWCGFVCAAAFFVDLVDLAVRATRASRPDKLAMPVLFASGEADPVGKMGRGVRAEYGRLLESGHRDVEMLLYPGARHELLNETNREEVYRDLAHWMKGLRKS